jgi:EmrB/QacA subfamily drug resistance transporter
MMICMSGTSVQIERRRWTALAVVLVAQLMLILDVSIVNVALPAIASDLHMGQADLTWVVNAYLITFGSFLLVAGRLGDLVGRKAVLLTGIALFTGASALCALAQDGTLLVVARFAQGLGAALASAVILALIAVEFPSPAERARAMSAYVFVSVSGGSIGLVAGGVLTQTLGWHWIFAINVPIGIATIAAGLALIEETPRIGLRAGVDVIGAALVTVAMLLGVYAIVNAPEQGWGSGATLGVGAGAIALLAAFAAWEARLDNPILPLHLLRLRSLIGSSVVRGLIGTALFGSFFVGALYLEHVLRYGTIATGAAFLPQTLVVAVLSLGPTTRLITRLGAERTLHGGLVITAAGLLLLALVDEHTAYFPLVFAAFTVFGAGVGASFMPLLTIAMSEVPPRDAGVASALINVAMYVSSALGLAALGAIASGHSHALEASGSSHAAALVGGYQLAFLLAAGVVAVGLVVALLVLRRRPVPALA